MDVIVGFGPIHDPLLAAALRGCGRPATAAAWPDAAALALGRMRAARGHPCPVYYLAGALLRHAQRAHAEASEPGRFVVPGDRCGAYATDLARALADAGNGAWHVTALAPERASHLCRDLGLDAAASLQPLAEAVAAGDALHAALGAMRSRGRDDDGARARIASVRADLERALEARHPVAPVLAARRVVLRPPRAADPPRVRVRVTGELWTTRDDGTVDGGLVAWMEAQGAAVETPSLAEWVLYAAWRGGIVGADYDALRLALSAARTRCIEALGHCLPEPVDIARWAPRCAQWMPIELCAGSGVLELATWFEVEHARSADLVVSLKPFASITSSAASDAVLHNLSARSAAAFLALELQGDLSVQLESRVALALRAATPTPGASS